MLAWHQLAPELAEDIARARLVILADAGYRGAPDTVSVRQVQPCPPRTPAWCHHLRPTDLLDLVNRLYGHYPPVFLITITEAFSGYSDHLSPTVHRALPTIADIIPCLQLTL